jgi:hypothetical protein
MMARAGGPRIRIFRPDVRSFSPYSDIIVAGPVPFSVVPDEDGARLSFLEPA